MPNDESSTADVADSEETAATTEPMAPIFEDEPEQAPVRLREIVAVLLVVLLADVTMYRGEGFAGLALLFAVAPLLLAVGAHRPTFGKSTWITGVLLVVLAARLVWCGSELQVAAGFVLLVAFAMSLSGLCPYMLEIGVFASQSIISGYVALTHYYRSIGRTSPAVSKRSSLNYVLPLLAFLLFGGLFVLANPDLRVFLGEKIDRIVTSIRIWITEYVPQPLEIGFWVLVLWVTLGLLRPVIRIALVVAPDRVKQRGTPGSGPTIDTFLYAPYRNTLLTVIVLFAVYLVFEFYTLSVREFERGSYSGYAHEGAAWLTLALALATVVLSLVFRGRVLHDPRLPRLRKLAWLWSMENMILAVAVYNRLGIYIGFNGMSPMRIVGIYGMTAVVIGFILVLIKIARHHDFGWLIRRHLWTLALIVYLFAITPVDWIVVRYNVARILTGDPAPVVQITEHAISSEGVLELIPLLESDNARIREGIAAMLAARERDAETLATERESKSWTAHQFADERAFAGLREGAERWNAYTDVSKRVTTLEEFREYAYQWY